MGGKKKEVTIGYRYYFGIHMGIGRGPVDELLAIKVGDRLAWSGSVTDNSTFRINAGSLFGGDKGEGGIDGTAMLMMGDPEQPLNNQLAAMLGGLVPSYRGVATLFYNGLVTSMNPYPKPWKMRVRRILKGWEGNVWYPAKAVIPLSEGRIKAMNPAHMLVEAATNIAWGSKRDISRLDLASYQRAADTLYDEGFGLCMRWSRQDKVSSFIQAVLDHIGGIQAVDRTTGLLTLQLIRADYDPEQLPLFTFDNGLLAVQELETAAQDTATNTLVVKYFDPINDIDGTSPPVQNLAAIQATGYTNASTVEYFGIPTFDLATRVAERDLGSSSGTIRRMTLVFDRRALDIRPCSVFRISAPDYGIENMVLRAGKVQDGTLTDGRITVTCVQDVFGLPATSYVKPQDSTWVPPDFVARPTVIRRLREQNYRDVYRELDQANLQLVEPTSGYIASMALPPEGVVLNYQLWTSLSNADYEAREVASFSPSGLISAAIPLGASQISVLLYSSYFLERVDPGTPAVIDNEEFVVVSIDPVLSVVVLERGAIDTIPAAHAAGARIWFYQDSQGEDRTEYLPGQIVYARLLTRTSRDVLEIQEAPYDTLQMMSRQGRPFPPGNVRISGQALSPTLAAAVPFDLTFAHRDRLVQGDQLFGHTYGNIGPEPGVTYTVAILSSGGAVLRTEAGVTSTTWSYTEEMHEEDGAPATFRLQLWSVRSGINSWQKYDIGVVADQVGLGYNLGRYLGGAV